MHHVQQCKLWNMFLMDLLERLFGHTWKILLYSQTPLKTIFEISARFLRDNRTTKSELHPPNATSLPTNYLYSDMLLTIKEYMPILRKYKESKTGTTPNQKMNYKPLLVL